ncbi:Low temperature requirement protein LtrA [Sanguibacter gelidistatuariae]|uniref:Low temperature requirement protein LtrA n=1 Tax=Sanguibacter gelidistatuariae TaxID=1814289 RepID=A0A1G6GXH9_9MICO|nr:low temperature requirement protein A [Sanguibacter gelidistatuariae]SDB86598.1 Low temperature requirement protein LtrA [Sanguibacter gelidistatuariae]
MSHEGAPARRSIRVRMTARDTQQEHRASTELELLFDLTFVVAVASATAQLAHGIAEGHATTVLAPFLQVFFAIWWAWMNFTWFASAYDTDDVLYRLMTMLQMGGVLLLAAGVPAAVDGDYRAVTLGYLVMRIGLVAQWLRAAREHPESRETALRYAAGISVVQVGWLLRLWATDQGLVPTGWQVPLFGALVVCELAVPVWAERPGSTAWHAEHIAERYGLFTIIVLGEGVLAASTGVQAALGSRGVSGSLVVIAVAGLVLIFALWWLYFLEATGDALARHRDRSYLWGYAHYGIFVALAALGAGLEVAVEQTGHHLTIPATVVGYAVAVPVATYLALYWAVHAPIVDRPRVRPVLLLGAAAAVLVLPLAAETVGAAPVVAGIAAICALVVAITVAAPREAVAPRPGG